MKAKIVQDIINKVKKFAHPNYQAQWINASTDLYIDLHLSELEIIELFIELENEIGTPIDLFLIKSAPSFKIDYIATLFNLTDIPNTHDSHYYYGSLIESRELNPNGEYAYSLKTMIEKLLSELPLWRKRISWYGIFPENAHMHFKTTNYIDHRIAAPFDQATISQKGRELIIFESAVDQENVNEFIDAINQFLPKWISGNCIILYNLCLNISKGQHPWISQIEYVEIEASYIPADTILEAIKNTFENAKVAIVIAHPHIGPYIYMCPNGHLHPVSDSTSIRQEHNGTNGYSKLFLSSYLYISFPAINVDCCLLGKLKKELCVFSQDSEVMIELAPACSFNGFQEESGWFVSAEQIKMCVDLVNADYNHPFSALQILQTKTNKVKLFLRRARKFNRQGEAVVVSLILYLNQFASKTIAFELIMLNDLSPCEYTGISSYYRNKSL